MMATADKKNKNRKKIHKAEIVGYKQELKWCIKTYCRGKSNSRMVLRIQIVLLLDHAKFKSLLDFQLYHP